MPTPPGPTREEVARYPWMDELYETMPTPRSHAGPTNGLGILETREFQKRSAVRVPASDNNRKRLIWQSCRQIRHERQESSNEQVLKV